MTEPDCCRDFALSRRSLLKGAVAVGGTMAVTQMFGEAMLQASFAGAPGGNTLVVISLRGGIDGLGVVVPHGDPGYYQVRPTTAVPKASVICADSMFGLHPAMAPLQPLWQSGRLAAIQATGLPVANRSHFAAIEEVEDAAPGSSTRAGWINRMVGMGSTTSSLDAVQLGMNSPTTAMTGPHPVLAAADLDSLKIPGLDGFTTQRYSSLQTMWSAGGPLSGAAGEAVTISQTAGAQLAAMPATATAYPTAWNATPSPSP